MDRALRKICAATLADRFHNIEVRDIGFERQYWGKIDKEYASLVQAC